MVATNKSVVATNKSEALYWVNLYKGNIKFVTLTLFSGLSEDKYIFSYALAKFQNLVRFE